MKKFLVSAVLCCGLCAVAQAQDVKFGVRTGLSHSSVTGSDAKLSTMKLGFVGGVFAEIPVGVDQFSVQPELQFLQLGGRDAAQPAAAANLNYLAMPILAKYQIDESFSVVLGPQVALLLNKSNVDDTVAGSVKSAFDLAVVAGVGYKIPETPVTVDLRGTYGFMNVFEDAAGSAVSSKNMSVQLGVSFELPFVNVK